MKPVWEEVESGMNRAPVPGGWIVQQYDQRYAERIDRWDWQMVSAFFVPDEAHQWDITANARSENSMDRKLHILQHSLGLDQFGDGSKYRNHFVAGEGSKDFDDCRALVADGLMTERAGSALSGGNSIFSVTPKGFGFVALNSPKPKTIEHAHPLKSNICNEEKNENIRIDI